MSGGLSDVGLHMGYCKLTLIPTRFPLPLISLLTRLRFGLAGVLATVLPFPTEQLLRLVGSAWTLQIYAISTVSYHKPLSLMLDQVC